MNQELVKSIMLILALLSVIVGFFMGIISSEFFSATIGGIITHFYQGAKVDDLKKVVASQSVKIQSLNAK